MDGSGDYLSSPSLFIASISTAATPLRATSLASQVLDPPPYFLSTPSQDRLQLHISPYL
ncbi:hypothetical protein M404DRAFT_998478 [Pisolithus tinctorius Marx 270]|uniref:Uncharacterized protein n=1 Tax=Pisolithus tinctorius Marx 270 TaxID=870435 RepID=A0A0C3KBM5_PISTI|nr:hypothetical protein M404DRAFT_998478 [Pisolithus tinctorius Marx 270]